MNSATEQTQRIELAYQHAAQLPLGESPHASPQLEQRWRDMCAILNEHPVEMGGTAEIAALLEALEPDPHQRFKVVLAALNWEKFTLTSTPVSHSKVSLRAKLQNLEAVVLIVSTAFYGTGDLEKLNIQKRPGPYRTPGRA